jgi:hypothetical protein
MTNRHPAWRAVRIALGIILVPLGIVGLFVPVLQGVLFLAIAFLLLSSEIPWVARQRDKLRARYPNLFRQAEHHMGNNHIDHDQENDEGSRR